MIEALSLIAFYWASNFLQAATLPKDCQKSDAAFANFKGAESDFGREELWRKFYPSVLNIFVRDHQGEVLVGSAFMALVGDSVQIVTAAHISSSPGLMYIGHRQLSPIVLPRGGASTSELYDQAFFPDWTRLSESARIPGAIPAVMRDFRSKPLLTGEPVAALGFRGPDRQAEALKCKYLYFERIPAGASTGRRAQMNALFDCSLTHTNYSGMSGGLIVDMQGRAVGSIIGSFRNLMRGAPLLADTTTQFCVPCLRGDGVCRLISK